MFQHRSSAFAPDISAIERRLRSLEKEIERLGRTAGRRASAGMSVASDHLADALASVSEIVDRLKSGRRFASDEAVRYGNEAVKFGTKVGNDALNRITSEVEHRPLATLAVAVGVGFLLALAIGRRE